MAERDQTAFASEDDAENRKSARVPVCFETSFAGETVSGNGVVRDISAGGALIEEVDLALEPGAEVTIGFSLYENSVPLNVRANVVRRTERGFAVEFVQMNPRTRKVLKTVLARARR